MLCLVAPFLLMTSDLDQQNVIPRERVPPPVRVLIYAFDAELINGQSISLGKFKGDVMLVVNVASKCGLTPQYKGLESLYKKYKSQGFTVLGFPANDFREQEPGSNAEIREFCEKNYGVTFPMFSKVKVTGDDASELFKWLVQHSGNPNPIEWNFAKFLISRTGRVVARFAPKVTPDDPALIAAIESELAKKS